MTSRYSRSKGDFAPEQFTVCSWPVSLDDITAHSGMPLSMNEVRYVGGLGPLLVIGPYDGVSRPGFEKLVRQFREAGLDVHPTDDIHSVIWKKLIANVSTNVVAALPVCRWS